MQSATFIGEVWQGRLLIPEPLADFEGKRVLVTLIAPDMPLSPPTPGLVGGEPVGAPRASEEAEILEDPGRIRTLSRSATTVTAQLVAVGRRPPRVSLEED
jgi:hypothetical protein